MEKWRVEAGGTNPKDVAAFIRWPDLALDAA